MTRWQPFQTVDELPVFPAVTPGVYVLFRDWLVVYVGIGGNVRNRIQSHARKFEFDAIKVKRLVSERDYRILEHRLIRRLRPVENKAIPANRLPWWV